MFLLSFTSYFEMVFFLTCLCRITLSGNHSATLAKRDASCGAGLTCGPDCQALCVSMHNYYRKLHDAPPMSCDPELAKSAQEWTDEQARAGNMHHSEWTDKFTESISWKGWGWEGMEKMEGAIPGATRSWYSEIRNDYNYATGKGNGQAVGHFMAVVWKGETKIGCGLNIKPDDGTYVTAHYAPASHANVDYFELAPKNVLPRKDPEPECDIRSSEREDCNADLKAPFVTPEKCLNAGCCYDDMFMSEPNVDLFGAEGQKWCFVRKGGATAPTEAPGSKTTGAPGVTEAPESKTTAAPGVTEAPESKTTAAPGVTEAPESKTTAAPGVTGVPGAKTTGAPSVTKPVPVDKTTGAPDVTTAPGTVPPSEGQFTGKNTCYMLRLIGTTWKGGQEVCGGFDSGNLVSIETEGEYKYIKGLIRLAYNEYNNGWYIGLEKNPNDGKWKWVSGEPLTISYWAPNEPADDGKFAMMSATPKEGSPGAFTATDGQSTYGIICEYKSDGKCPTASLVR